MPDDDGHEARWKPELVVVPVSDLDRTKAFYRRGGTITCISG
jgi:hypothetical protein